MKTPIPNPIWPKSEADPPEVEFLDGFAAGAELSRQSAYSAWIRYSAWLFRTGLASKRNSEERLGFDNGLSHGRAYARTPQDRQPMTAEQHNKYPKGRFTP